MELTCLSNKTVYLDGKKLDLKSSLKRYSHSPTGFSWGYSGSGCAQLALAVMMEMLKGRPEYAYDFGYDMPNNGEVIPEVKKHYQTFKNEVIARLPFGKQVALEFDFWGWYEGKSTEKCIQLLKVIDVLDPDDEEGEGNCSQSDKCQKADCKNCDCACKGNNHGLQKKLF